MTNTIPESLPEPLKALLKTLDAPQNWRVQKAWVAGASAILELFGGQKCYLLLDGTTGRLEFLGERPKQTNPPPVAQKTLREALCPARLTNAAVNAETAVVSLHFVDQKERPRSLHLEMDANAQRLVLTGLGKASGSKKNVAPGIERILLVLGATSPRETRDLRRGRAYQQPPSGVLPNAVTASSTTPPPQHTPTTTGDSDGEKRNLLVRLNALARRQKRLFRKLNADLEKHGDPALLQEQGELLKLVMTKVGRGSASVEVQDTKGERVEIPLIPQLDAKGNLASLFKRAKRAKTARAHITPRQEGLRREMDSLRALRLALDTGHPEALEQIETLLAESQTGTARRQAALKRPRQEKRLSWRTFASSTGVLLLVGRSAKDNDVLTFQQARGNDLWAHARNVPGSHVIARLLGQEPSEELILEMAHLAVHFSPARKQERADVQYTRRKNVRKAGRGAPAGSVHLSDEKVVHLVMNGARLQTLLKHEQAR